MLIDHFALYSAQSIHDCRYIFKTFYISIGRYKCMACIGASILQLDFAGAGFDWTAFDDVFHAMVGGCVWLDLVVVLPTDRRTVDSHWACARLLCLI